MSEPVVLALPGYATCQGLVSTPVRGPGEQASEPQPTRLMSLYTGKRAR